MRRLEVTQSAGAMRASALEVVTSLEFPSEPQNGLGQRVFWVLLSRTSTRQLSHGERDRAQRGCAVGLQPPCLSLGLDAFETGTFLFDNILKDRTSG